MVGQATMHVNQVESRANELISQLQSKHQAEIAQLQATANEAHQEAQQQIDQLLTQLSVQHKMLDEQWLEQKGLHKTIKALQEEVAQLRRSNELQQSSQNGAGIDVAELMSTIHELRREVKGAISPAQATQGVAVPIAHPPVIPMYSRNEVYEQPGFAASACAGYDPNAPPSGSGSSPFGRKSPGSSKRRSTEGTPVLLTWSTSTSIPRPSDAIRSPRLQWFIVQFK